MGNVATGYSQVGMPELRLNLMERHALACELEREGMAQPMRVDALLDASLPSQTLQQVPNVGAVESSAFQCAEERCPAVDPKRGPPI